MTVGLNSARGSTPVDHVPRSPITRVIEEQAVRCHPPTGHVANFPLGWTLTQTAEFHRVSIAAGASRAIAANREGGESASAAPFAAYRPACRVQRQVRRMHPIGAASPVAEARGPSSTPPVRAMPSAPVAV